MNTAPFISASQLDPGIEIDWRKFCATLSPTDFTNLEHVTSILHSCATRTEYSFAVAAKLENSEIILIVCPISYRFDALAWEETICHVIGRQRIFAHGDFVRNEGKQLHNKEEGVSYVVYSYFPDFGKEIQVRITSDFTIEDQFDSRNEGFFKEYSYRQILSA